MTATSDDFSGHTLQIDVNLQAPRASVWRCWTETAIFCQWFCPAPWKVTEADFDLRPGGRMNNVMQGPNGERFDNTGIWLVIEPMSRLVFTDAFREGYIPLPNPFMTGFVELSDTGQGATRMVWEHGMPRRRMRESTWKWASSRAGGQSPGSWKTLQGACRPERKSLAPRDFRGFRVPAALDTAFDRRQVPPTPSAGSSPAPPFASTSQKIVFLTNI